MGLDCIPRRCGCPKHPQLPSFPAEGAVHLPGVPCPFQSEQFPVGPFGTCCSLRGKVAARELQALGESDLSDRMYKDMSAEEALAFAEELRRGADRLEEAHRKDAEKPKGAGWDGTWDPEKNECVWGAYSTFGQALAAVREAARWYSMVGERGFGVRAWY